MLVSKPVYIQSLSKAHLHCFKNTYVGLNKQSTWYQYGFKEPQGPLQKPNIGPIILGFREYFLDHFSLRYHTERNHASLLVRKHNRKILNENEVIKIISIHTGLETISVSLDASTILEVIEEIMDSSLVVGMHGSLMILSIFLKPHSIVIELFPYGIDPDISTPYKTLCDLSDLRLFYRVWKNDLESNSYPHPEYPPNLGGISHLSSKEQEYIQNSFVKPFLCCDNPPWLYRIYQDTVVDPQSFGTLLQDAFQDIKKVPITELYHKSVIEDNSQSSKYHLHPGEVQNAFCNISNKSKAILALVWDEPWNLKFMNAVNVDYEIWLQEIGGEDVQAFLTKSNKFLFPMKSVEKAYYAWVRCYANEIVGPFISNPIICSFEFIHNNNSNYSVMNVVKTMDGFLNYLGLYRSDVAKDCSSLFRVVSEQLFYTQVHHVKLREGCVEYMQRNKTLFEPLINQDFDEYLDKIKNLKEWAGEVEMKALSLKYKIDFVVYYDISKPPLKIKANSSSQTISLACTGGSRYDCVYSKSDLSTLAFCQSIVYEVLYKKVYELGSDVDVAVEKMLHDKAYSKQRRNNLLCHYFRESCRLDNVIEDPNLPEDDQSYKNPRLEIRKALAHGVPPFPYKVAKTLDPGIYRNVEFDMWNEKRKEDQKNEQFVIPKLEPGVKCKVHINKDIYIGHVQDIFNDCENVSIYIEELCKRCIVSTSVLEIVPVPAYKGLDDPQAVDVQVRTNIEKNKLKKMIKKPQDHSPVHNSGNNSMKPNIIARSNSLPTSSSQRNTVLRSNSMYSSPQMSRKKGHQSSAPFNHKPKHMLQNDSRNGQAICSPQNFPCMWNGISPSLPTSPIPIPGKTVPDCYQTQPGSPEVLNDFNDSGWTEDSFKSPSPNNFSPPFIMASSYSDPSYTPMPVNSFAIVSPNPASMPVPIPGNQTASPPVAEELPTSPLQQPQCPTPMTIYPYPIYAVPSMYFVCRDGSTLPMNVGAPWGTREGLNGTEVSSGVPSMYFNTPPTGMSPPQMAPWIPATIANYGSTWTPAMSSAVAFTPPLEMNTYQSLLSPPWSPQSGLYIPSPTAVAYQVQPPPPPPPPMIPPEPPQK
ncbi:protein O-linked-mannose beta-1,4-N-acetylglucosaminyltransferase 2 [Nephila pilipes]|uniref:Protein O-linked-mannose beta-1,4-N-acetylglucosaminyltransferase 2 n=1 Tax=Nephila pilipes TaxID=299642 RepID=A0A8X6UNS0_NEPPI|nr:protein O-linked-mannose beta-1,4-N-acetylglucosaminyltransferase 2 [Nephila pilipes]